MGENKIHFSLERVTKLKALNQRIPRTLFHATNSMGGSWRTANFEWKLYNFVMVL